MEFETTNNTTKFEALILGLKAAIEIWVNHISVFSDFELIIQQFKNIYQVKKPKLISYRNEVWDIIEKCFIAFNITFIHRDLNQLANSLATLASTFKAPREVKASYEIQVKYKPSVPNNIKHWKVFQDDREVKRFLECVEEFAAIQIDNEEDITDPAEKLEFKDTLADQKIIELKTNHIRKGLVPLERLFDTNVVYLKSEKQSSEDNTMNCNIGKKRMSLK